MDVVCGTSLSSSSPSISGADKLLNGSANQSCNKPSDKCDTLYSVDKYVITNSCALFDFAVYTIVMGSLSSLGVIGNVVSFVVLLRDRGRSATSFLLQALAVADTMVLLAAVPLYILPPIYPYTSHLESYYLTYMSIMPILWPLFVVPYTFTVLVTVLVSMHRYCAVCKPTVTRCGRIVASSSAGGRGAGGGGRRPASIRFSPSTGPQARRRVVVLAVFSIVYNIPRFFEYESVPVCNVTGSNETRYAFGISAFGDNLIYRILYANVLYFIVIHGGPLLLIGFFNVKLIMALKRRQRRWAEMGKGWYQQDVSLVLVVVMCVFIVCQTPTFIDHILWTFVDESARTCGQWHYYYTAIGDLLVIFNSSVNFVIYILTSRNFRHGLVMQTLSAWANGLGGGGGGVNAGGTFSTFGVGRNNAGRRTTECVELHIRSGGDRNNCVGGNRAGVGVTASGAALALTAVVENNRCLTPRDGEMGLSGRRTTNCSIELRCIEMTPTNTPTVALSTTPATIGNNKRTQHDQQTQQQQHTAIRYFEPRVLFQ